MSDSEDDFMSDKFLVEAAPSTETYSSKRKRQEAQSAARAKENEKLPLREREAQRRREGLNRSLFEDDDGERAAKPKEQGQAKAMDLMMKMGWKVGEGLGRRRSASPDKDKPEPSGRADREREEDAPRGGIGARPAVGASMSTAGIGSTARSRAEPVRISMWAGRKGLAARSPSPPPLNKKELSDERLRELGNKASHFRGRWGAENSAKDVERKAEKARNLLIEYDAEKGVKFHPLHAQPGNPRALPRPLLKLIYPEITPSPTSSPCPPAPAVLPNLPPAPSLSLPPGAARAPAPAIRNNFNKAEQLREQMRREMLSELGGDDEGSVRFGIPTAKDALKEEVKADDEQAAEDAQVDWEEMVSGTKRVLSMSPEEQLAYLVSQLRNEHMFCFWCAYKYASFEEMDGFGGCPGEDEDDH